MRDHGFQIDRILHDARGVIPVLYLLCGFKVLEDPGIALSAISRYPVLSVYAVIAQLEIARLRCICIPYIRAILLPRFEGNARIVCGSLSCVPVDRRLLGHAVLAEDEVRAARLQGDFRSSLVGGEVTYSLVGLLAAGVAQLPHCNV